MSTYEIAILYHPDLEMDFEPAAKRVKALIEGVKGKIVAEDIWDKRKLAYPIKGQNQAIYAFYQVEIDGQVLGELEKSFNIQKEILRYLITKLDLKAIARAQEAKAAAEAAANV